MEISALTVVDLQWPYLVVVIIIIIIIIIVKHSNRVIVFNGSLHNDF